jgi:excisionase family DNA binding protein
MNMNQSVMMLSKRELEDIICQAVAEALQAFSGSFQQKETKKYLSVEEAAKYLNVSTSTIYRKVQDREIPHLKKGKYLYFRPEELDAYLLEGRQKTVVELENEIIGTLKTGGKK